MMGVVTKLEDGRRTFSLWGWFLASLIITGFLFFFIKNAIVYFVWSEASYGPDFWPIGKQLLVHVTGGSIVIFAGLFQLWTGITQNRMTVHPITGRIYVIGVLVGSIGAIYMVPNAMREGLAYASGSAGMAVAWLLTTGMAYFAIRRKKVLQHKEWMIRSFVVTGGFISARLMFDYMPYKDWGFTFNEFGGMAMWACWVVPLMVTEAIIQGRKI